VIEVRPTRDDREVAAALVLREEVFVGEQGVSLAEERDGRDEEALHIVVVDDGVVVATCRLLVEGSTVKLGRMAVARTRRGLGLARALITEAEARARALGAERMVLAAQLNAQALYDRAGYDAYGDVFLDAGIEHVMMSKALS
jgi:predicted GNAT family N-acyltransferase